MKKIYGHYKEVKQVQRGVDKYLKGEDRKSVRSFVIYLKSKGWRRLNGGIYKGCLYNGDVVIKVPKPYLNLYDFENAIFEIGREQEQYKIKGFTKYLPRLYMKNRIILVQEKLNRCKCGGFGCKPSSKIANEFPLYDWEHNHGIDANGNIKFFDWVYKRNDYYLGTNTRLR